MNVSGFNGNFGIILRAYAYILMLGRENVKLCGKLATLGANYIKESLKDLYYNFTELMAETVSGSLHHSCRSELTRQGISLP